MKWYKVFSVLLPVVYLVIQIYYFYYQQKQTYLYPLITQQQNIRQLETQLQLSQINYSNLQFFQYRHEAEFVVNSRQAIKVIVSLQKDTLSQVSALQNILKKANIIQDVNLIDLSSTPAYATFQNF